MPVRKTKSKPAKPEPANNPTVLLLAVPNTPQLKARFNPVIASTTTVYDDHIEDDVVSYSGFSIADIAALTDRKMRRNAFELRHLPHVIREFRSTNGRGWKFHVVTVATVEER
jgi:hypothetical protein